MCGLILAAGIMLREAMLVILILVGAAVILFITLHSFSKTLRSEAQARAAAERQTTVELAKNQQRITELRRSMNDDPGNRSVHEELVQIAIRFPSLAATVYNIALEAVESTNGAPGTKQLALKAGRLHYGALRPDGTLTVYDEQALQNDISARTSD
jgi:hypothetical protein